MYKHILIATDGSDLAQKAVGQGLALARALDAKALVVSITEPWRTSGASDCASTSDSEIGLSSRTNLPASSNAWVTATWDAVEQATIHASAPD